MRSRDVSIHFAQQRRARETSARACAVTRARGVPPSASRVRAARSREARTIARAVRGASPTERIARFRATMARRRKISLETIARVRPRARREERLGQL